MHAEVPTAEVSSDGFQFGINRKLLRATVPAKMFIVRDAGAACIALGHLDLFHNVEAQERFSDNDFVAVAKCLALSRGQSLATVDERTVRRSQVF